MKIINGKQTSQRYRRHDLPPPSMVKKIGKTTYLVWAHFSETSTETMEDKIKRMLREEVRQMMAQE